MGTPEQDLAVYLRDQERAELEREAIELESVQVRAEVEKSAKLLGEVMLEAMEYGAIDPEDVAVMVIHWPDALEDETFGEVVNGSVQAIRDAIEPYLERKVEEIAARRVQEARERAEMDAAESRVDY